MDNLPNNLLRKIHALIIDPKDKGRLRSSSTTQRRISKNVDPNLHKGPPSYLHTAPAARYQNLYDDWDSRYREARSNFLDSPEFYTTRKFAYYRLHETPQIVKSAKKAYRRHGLLELIHQTWGKECPRDSVERDMYKRVKRRLKKFSKQRKKTYEKTLKVLRRWKGKPTAEEEKELGTYAMDALMAESLLFYNSNMI
jgi:hypothetical protein